MQLAADSTEQIIDPTQSAADALLAEADAAAAAETEMRNLLAAINEANGVGQDAISANIAYQDSLAELDTYIQKAREGAEGYALGLDQATQVGRDNMGMLVGLSGEYQTAAEKQFALDGNTESYIANLQAGRDAVLQRARDLGATDEQVQMLSDTIVGMPSEKEVKIIAETNVAADQVRRFIAGLPQTFTVFGNVNWGETQQNASSALNHANGAVYENGVKAFANGGFEPGIYPYTQGGIHKFAEEYGEAYISMDPARADRSRQVWVEAGNRLGATQDMVRSIVAEMGGGRGGAVINQTINPAPGMSEAEIGRIAAAKMNWALRTA